MGRNCLSVTGERNVDLTNLTPAGVHADCNSHGSSQFRDDHAATEESLWPGAGGKKALEYTEKVVEAATLLAADEAASTQTSASCKGPERLGWRRSSKHDF